MGLFYLCGRVGGKKNPQSHFLIHSDRVNEFSNLKTCLFFCWQKSGYWISLLPVLPGGGHRWAKRYEGVDLMKKTNFSRRPDLFWCDMKFGEGLLKVKKQKT